MAEFELGVPLRADAGAAIEELRGMGLAVIIASGDSGATVTSAARSLGITRAHSRLTPDDKIRLLQELRATVTACS